MVRKSTKLNYADLKWIGPTQKRFDDSRFKQDYSNQFLENDNNKTLGIAAKNLLTFEMWWNLLPYLTLFDKLMLSYVNKELYFIVHANIKF